MGQPAKPNSLKKKITDNGGYLHIKGFGASKRIILMDSVMPIGQFNWGFNSSMSESLAYHILYYSVGKELASKWKTDFMESIVAQLPVGSFDVKINLGKWEQVMKGEHEGGFVHAYEFIEFKVKDRYFSKFLDFPSFDYSSAVLGEDTKEYQLLKNMLSAERKEYEEYLTAKTMEKALPSEENNAKKHAEVKFSDQTYTITNLLGNIKNTYSGNLLSLWDQH